MKMLKQKTNQKNIMKSYYTSSRRKKIFQAKKNNCPNNIEKLTIKIIKVMKYKIKFS